MPAYRLRLTPEECDDDVFVGFLKEHATVQVAVHHTPASGDGEDRPHYHAYIETKQSANNFPTYIKRAYAGKAGNGFYSNKKCDEDRKIEYLQYLWNTKKGNVPRLVAQDGFSPLDIATYMENAKTYAKEFAQRLKETRKMTKQDIAELLAERYTVNSPPSEIQDAVIDMLHKNRMCTGIFVVKDIMATVLTKLGSHKMKALVLKTFLD